MSAETATEDTGDQQVGNEAIKSENDTPKTGNDQSQNNDADVEKARQAANVEMMAMLKRGKKIHPSGKTIIVKNLPASSLFTFAEELKELLGKYGEISYVKRGGISVDYNTTHPTLTAYVTFEKAESSEQALAEKGTSVGGNPIDIEVLNAGVHTAVVTNLPFIISNECIHQLFSSCGAIKEIVKIPARPTAFVEFEEEEGLVKALSLNQSILINNMDILVQRRGADQIKKEKGPRNSNNMPRGNKRPVGLLNKPRGGGGGWGNRGGNRNHGGGVGGQGGGGGVSGGYGGSWDSPMPPAFQNPHYGGGGGGMQYGNNNWGNGNFARDGMSDNERAYKRRKQNDWIWQY